MDKTPAGEPSGFSAFVKKNDEGLCSLMLNVKGVRCASCVQLIENALFSEDDVTSARVNMSTERLNIVWNGQADRAESLTTLVTKLGYQVWPFDDSEHDETGSLSYEKWLLRCIAVAGFAMGNLMMISVGLWASDAKTMGVATQDMFHIISALIALPAIIFSGRPFFYSAITVLKGFHTNMDVPISLAVILTTAMSVVEAMNQGDHIYFDSAVMLLFFLLIGRYLDTRAKGKAKQSAKGLLSMLHGTATVLEAGRQRVLAIRDLREGMNVLVAAGEKIPADGVLTEGTSEVDMSLITGESLPQLIKVGDHVFAGTVNLATPVCLSVSKASDRTLLSDIVKLMETAEQGQARYVRLADRAARLYTPVVHGMGVLTFLGWWVLMGETWQLALLNAITVLIITCPCALGLAVPVVQVLASSRLMHRGVLLKSGDALEKLAKTDIAVFDKTGTLTVGKPKLLPGEYTPESLKLAASIASRSKHPLSKAVCQAYTGVLYEAMQVEELPGLGLQGMIDGKRIRLGSRAWCGEGSEQSGSPVLSLYLNIDAMPVSQFCFSDYVREDASTVISRLKEKGISSILLSGDQENMVKHVAKEVGVAESYAALTPQEKHQYIDNLHAQGHYVLMVGDGLNDAPSMAAADVSISPSTAVDITQNTADIVFQGDRLGPVLGAWQIARDANSLIKQNFMLAVLYNLIAIPIAIMGFVTPLIAAIAMSGSSLIVVGNSFRLNLTK